MIFTLKQVRGLVRGADRYFGKELRVSRLMNRAPNNLRSFVKVVYRDDLVAFLIKYPGLDKTGFLRHMVWNVISDRPNDHLRVNCQLVTNVEELAWMQLYFKADAVVIKDLLKESK